MRAFYGGQIVEGRRGDLAVIVSKQQQGREQSHFYNVFLPKIDSEEFVRLTGVVAVKCPLERAYIGVSQEAGEKIVQQFNGRHVAEQNSFGSNT